MIGRADVEERTKVNLTTNGLADLLELAQKINGSDALHPRVASSSAGICRTQELAETLRAVKKLKKVTNERFGKK